LLESTNGCIKVVTIVLDVINSQLDCPIFVDWLRVHAASERTFLKVCDLSAEFVTIVPEVQFGVLTEARTVDGEFSSTLTACTNIRNHVELRDEGEGFECLILVGVT